MKIKRLRRAKGTGGLKKRGSIWYLLYSDRSTRKRKAISTGCTVKADAEVWAAKFLLPQHILEDKDRLEYYKSQIKVKDDELKEIESAKRKVAIFNILETYYARGNSPSIVQGTKDKNESMFRFFDRWVEKNLTGKRWLDEITRDDIVDFLAHMQKSIMASTYNSRLLFYRSVFKALGSTVFDGFRLLPEDDVVRTPFSDEEILRIEDELERRKKNWKDGQRWDELLMLVRLGYMIGQRQEDIVNLRWDAVDFEKGLITVKPLKTYRKTHKAVYIPLFPRLREILSGFTRYDSNGGVILPKMLEKWRRHTLKACFSKLLKSLGIDNMKEEDGKRRMYKSLHSLRHNFISFCANNEVPLDVVRSISLHCNEKMIRKYYHEDSDRAQRVMDAMSAVVERLRPKNKQTVETHTLAKVAEEDKLVPIEGELFGIVMKDKSKSFNENLRNMIKAITTGG